MSFVHLLILGCVVLVLWDLDERVNRLDGRNYARPRLRLLGVALALLALAISLIELVR